MKALCCTSFGSLDDLEIVEVDDPVAGPGEVVVDVKAAGVGFVDALQIQGLYQIKPPLPYFPGSDFAGVVAEVGEGVRHLHEGDRVMGAASGAFAPKVKMPARAAMRIPDVLDDQIAGGFYTNYATALYGLRDCGQLQSGETLFVMGASGGVGSAAIAVAKAMGARVIAGASSQAKLDAARAAGADDGVLYGHDNWRDDLRAAIGEAGLDMVYDPVGGDLSEVGVRSLSPGGRFLVVGFTSGTIARIPLNLVLLKRCAIVGVNWGEASRVDPALGGRLMETLVPWLESGRLRPAAVNARRLSDVREALADQIGGHVIGKLVLTA